MQINQRKAGVLLNYVSEAIKVLTALIYTPIMLRLLGQSEYGLYQLVSSTVSYLSLLSLGFGSAYVRYYSRYRVKDDEAGIAKLNGMFISIFCAMALVCLLCGAIMTANVQTIFGTGLTAPELEKAKILLAILIVNMALTFPNSVFNCYITAHEQFVFQKVVMVAQNLLNPFLALPLLLMGYGSVAMVLITSMMTVVGFLVNVYFCFRKLKMQIAFQGMEFSLLREMSVFTFFIFLNQIIDQINWSVDKFLLGRICGTAAVAIYGIGGQINSLYIQLSTSISGVFVPRINQIVAQNDDNEELTQLMVRVGRIQFFVVMLAFSGFAIWGKKFISLWAGANYSDAYMVALLLMVSMIIPLIQNIGLEIQRAKNMHQARSIVYFSAAVINVIVSVILIRYWGVVGAAAGTAICLFICTGIFMNWYYHSRIGLNMKLFWRKIAGLIPASILVIIFGVVLYNCIQINSWMDLIISIILYSVVYGFVMWCIGCNQYEKHLIKEVVRKMQKE